MKITLTDLKNTMKVAKHTQKTESFTAHLRNDKRDINVIVSYSPVKDIKEDIYPFFKIEMTEEELFHHVYLSEKQIKEVKELYNSFITQGENSFLETLLN